MKVPFIDLKAQYETIRGQVEPAVLNLLASQNLVLGEPVEQFEKHMADYIGCNYAVGMSSGTDALICCLMALGIGSGDEVIVPTFTFFASAGAIARVGATPVFVDIDAETFNLDVDKASQAITGRTRAIMPVDLYGQMAPMKQITALAAAHGLAVIEDACQSVGARQDGKGPGQVCGCACLSFYPTKNLGGVGDGGMVLCQDEELAQKCKHLRVHGDVKRYCHTMIGANFRLDALQATVLDIKLNYLDEWAARRREHGAAYDKLLGAGVQKPRILPGNESVYNQYAIQTPRRDDLQRFLSKKTVGCGVYYPSPLHLQECFAYLGGNRGDCPVAEQVCEDVLSLPMYPELSAEQLAYVAHCVNEFCER